MKEEMIEVATHMESEPIEVLIQSETSKIETKTQGKVKIGKSFRTFGNMPK